MRTQTELIKIFGDPIVDNLSFERKWMQLWYPTRFVESKINCLPSRVYVNKLLIPHLEKTFLDLIEAELHTEIVTFDGCFNLRKKRGQNGISLHAFGMAIDMNAQTNPFGGNVTWSKDFLAIWRNNGWICGADWSGRSKDGMHFQGDGFV